MSNSAQRLHDALVSLRKYANSNQRADVIWSEAFETGEISRPEFLRQLAKFLELPAVVRVEVQAAEADLPEELLLEWYPKLQAALKHLGANTAINTFSGRITDEILLGLRFCATLLAKHSPEKILSPKNLSDLLNKAIELRQEVVESEMDLKIKRVLTARFDDVISAIIAYRITGTPGVEESFDRILGSMMRENSVWERSGETTVGRKVFNFVKNLGVLLAFAWTAVQLTDRVADHLSDKPAEAVQIEKVSPAAKNHSDKNRRASRRSIEI